MVARPVFRGAAFTVTFGLAVETLVVFSGFIAVVLALVLGSLLTFLLVNIIISKPIVAKVIGFISHAHIFARVCYCP